MQEFACPQCGRISRYDPWAGPARCEYCGYTPPPHAHIGTRFSRQPTGAHQLYLNQIIALWNGTHQPDPTFIFDAPDTALAFFRSYRQAMGENPQATGPSRYVRDYEPAEHEVRIFVGAYARLIRGDRAAAARELGALTMSCPQFVDPWVWLAAAVDDPARREECLQHALALEPAHPLAQDAIAILRGRVRPAEKRSGIRRLQHKIGTSKCPQCGATLHYQAGAAHVTCPHCGYQLQLQQARVIETDAAPLSDLQLKRRYQGFRWLEVQRTIRCQSCGAEMSMTYRLAQTCLFCGSANILVRDNLDTFERPSGLLPFVLDQTQAAEAVRQAQHSGLRAIKTWIAGTEQRLQSLEGIYLPFWVFDGFVEVRTWFEQTVSTPSRTMPPPRSDQMVLDNLLLPGMARTLGRMLNSLQPFDLDALVPYEPRLLADWPAALYTLDVEAAADTASERMIALARRRAPTPTPPSTDSSYPVRLKRSFQVSSMTYQLLLLPVWVALLAQEGQLSLALVNGQTGRVVFGPRLPGAQVAV